MPDSTRDSAPPEEGEERFSSPPPSDVHAELRSVRHPIPFSMLDPDAVKVVRRLSRYGYEAYLVGGCVRDILLGRRPKDFDVATSAMPAEIRRLFRNCRLIGRRFRLAHLLFKNRKIIEVATFRRSPTLDDDVSDRHAAENLFGGQADDAIRRDFTINALMYDVGRKEIRDWVDGLGDIESATLRTIGDPHRRLTEDPVRIVRAVKFAVRLELAIEPPLREAMQHHAGLISTCAPARLAEEGFKLLRSGSAAACFDLLHQVGVMPHLMPGLAANPAFRADPQHALRFLRDADAAADKGRAVTDPVLMAALFYPACRDMLAEPGDAAKNLEQVLTSLIQPMSFTRRQMARVRQVLLAQRRLAGGPRTRRSRKILEREYAEEAIDLLELTAETPEQTGHADAWRRLLASRYSRKGAADSPRADDQPQPAEMPRSRRRRRRPRRKKPEQPEGDKT
jgi:poly(A) polymerase